MISLTHIKAGHRILASSLNLKKNRHKRHSGTAKDICHNVVRDCFNGKYFMASNSNYTDFWVRDFGWCVDSLMKLGYKRKVHSTLKYALDIFRKHKRTATTIDPEGVPFDVYTYAPDTLAWLLRSARIAKFDLAPYMDFIRKEYQRFLELSYDKETNLVRSNYFFSTAKDYAIRQSSLYDNCMLYVIADELQRLGIQTELDKDKIKRKIRKEFWNGKYFYDDLQKKNYVAGDAQLFPFFLNLFDNRAMLRKALQSCIDAGLDKPYPLSYTRNAKTDFIPYELLIYGYQRDTIWTHLGIIFMKLMDRVNKKKAKAYREQFNHLILNSGTFPEVINENGKLFQTPLYHSSTGMLWAANFLK